MKCNKCHKELVPHIWDEGENILPDNKFAIGKWQKEIRICLNTYCDNEGKMFNPDGTAFSPLQWGGEERT